MGLVEGGGEKTMLMLPSGRVKVIRPFELVRFVRHEMLGVSMNSGEDKPVPRFIRYAKYQAGARPKPGDGAQSSSMVDSYESYEKEIMMLVGDPRTGSTAFGSVVMARFVALQFLNEMKNIPVERIMIGKDVSTTNEWIHAAHKGAIKSMREGGQPDLAVVLSDTLFVLTNSSDWKFFRTATGSSGALVYVGRPEATVCVMTPGNDEAAATNETDKNETTDSGDSEMNGEENKDDA